MGDHSLAAGEGLEGSCLPGVGGVRSVRMEWEQLWGWQGCGGNAWGCVYTRVCMCRALWACTGLCVNTCRAVGVHRCVRAHTHTQVCHTLCSIHRLTHLPVHPTHDALCAHTCVEPADVTTGEQNPSFETQGTPLAPRCPLGMVPPLCQAA